MIKNDPHSIDTFMHSFDDIQPLVTGSDRLLLAFTMGPHDSFCLTDYAMSDQSESVCSIRDASFYIYDSQADRMFAFYEMAFERIHNDDVHITVEVEYFSTEVRYTAASLDDKHFLEVINTHESVYDYFGIDDTQIPNTPAPRVFTSFDDASDYIDDEAFDWAEGILPYSITPKLIAALMTENKE